MLHGDTHLSKYSHLKYIESFVTKCSSNYKNKWVDLDKGVEKAHYTIS